MGFAPNPHWRRCPKAPGRTRRLAPASVWGFVQKSVRLLLQVLFFRHSPKGLWVKGGYPCAGYTFWRRRRGRAVPQWSAGVKPLKKPFLIQNPHWRRCPKAPGRTRRLASASVWGFVQKSVRLLLQVLFFRHSPKGLWVKGGYPCAGYTFWRRRRGRAVPQKKLKKA